MRAKGYAAKTASERLGPFEFQRREPGPKDVEIEILFCGVCHSDLHQARDDWGGSAYPMVPGHEIVGKVSRIGPQVTRFRVGDVAGIGCLVDSCEECLSCRDGLEQYCAQGATATYNDTERDGTTPTYGGYSDRIVAKESFVLKIPANLDLAGVAPLLCAGITTYSPLRHWKAAAGKNVGIVGLGGLGHMGVKLARAMGARVAVFTTSASKKDSALSLGAHEVILSRDPGAMAAQAGKFDLILDTVSAAHELSPLLGTLRLEGTLVLLGIPPKAFELRPFGLIGGRRRVAGSLIGGVAETQEMLEFCAKHGIVSDIEMISIQKVEEAYERMIRGDVKYRFVIDMKSLKNPQ